MKNILFFTAAFLLSIAGNSQIQVLAGEVPDGQTQSDLNQTIAINSDFIEDSIAVDIDCDLAIDLYVHLRFGDLPVDGAHWLYIKNHNPYLEYCSDGDGRMMIFEENELIACGEEEDWNSEQYQSIASYGGWGGPVNITGEHQYVGFKLGNQLGWIRLSWSLEQTNGEDMFATVESNLIVCDIDNTSEVETIKFEIFPNPSENGTVNITAGNDLTIDEVIVTDSQGKIARRFTKLNTNGMRLELPEALGLYQIGILSAGKWKFEKVVRR